MKKSEKLAAQYDRQRRALAQLTANLDKTGEDLLAAQKAEKLAPRRVMKGRKCVRVWPARLPNGKLVTMQGFMDFTRDSNYKEPSYAYVKYVEKTEEGQRTVSDATGPTFISIFYAKKYARLVRCYNRLIEHAQVFPGEHVPR